MEVLRVLLAQWRKVEMLTWLTVKRWHSNNIHSTSLLSVYKAFSGSLENLFLCPQNMTGSADVWYSAASDLTYLT